MNVAIEEVLARLELVAVEAGRRSAEIESARALPSDLVDALIDTGVFRLTVPVAFGGLDAGPADVARAAKVSAYHDGSTGWVVASALAAGANAAGLPRHHAATVLGEPRTIVAGHGGIGGSGRVTEDGGLVVNGRWSWGSGVAAASWIGAGVRIDERDAADGPVVGSLVRCLFRRDQVVALDTWHAVGLRGSGSTDFQVTEAFVPEGRWVVVDEPTPDQAPGSASAASPASPTSSASTEPMEVVGVAAVALGLAARALDEATSGSTTESAGPGVRNGAGAAIGADQDRSGAGLVGRAERARLGTALAAADALLDRAIAEVGSGDGPASGPIPRAGVTAAATHAVETSVRVVEHCYREGGPAAVLHASALQRLLRDVQVVAQHPAVAPAVWARLASDGPPAT